MQPTIQTHRLNLRPFSLEDAATVQRLAGDIRVAEPTASVPHPYPDGAAETWISTHSQIFEEGKGITCAVELAAEQRLVGCISLLEISAKHQRAEMGYWIGYDDWSTGVCTEAAAALIQFANERLGVTRIVARCLARNLASARVMEKAGLKLEGRQIEHANHNGVFEDLLLYGLSQSSRKTRT